MLRKNLCSLIRKICKDHAKQEYFSYWKGKMKYDSKWTFLYNLFYRIQKLTKSCTLRTKRWQKCEKKKMQKTHSVIKSKNRFILLYSFWVQSTNLRHTVVRDLYVIFTDGFLWGWMNFEPVHLHFTYRHILHFTYEFCSVECKKKGKRRALHKLNFVHLLNLLDIRVCVVSHE